MALALWLVGCQGAPSASSPTPAPSSTAAALELKQMARLADFQWDLSGLKQTDQRPLLRGKTLVLDVTARAISPVQERIRADRAVHTPAEGSDAVCLVLVKSREVKDAPPPTRPPVSLPDYEGNVRIPGRPPMGGRIQPPPPPPPPPGPTVTWEVAVLDVKTQTLSSWHTGNSPGSPGQELYYGQLASYINGLDWNADPNFVVKEKQWTAAEARTAIGERYGYYNIGWSKRNTDYLVDLYSRDFQEKGKPAYPQRIAQIKADFEDTLKLENEVGVLTITQETTITDVKLDGPARAKVRYRSLQCMIQKEPGHELRLEDESVGMDIWACQDNTWRIVEEPEGKMVRSQKILNGKVVENFPLQ